MALLSMSYRWAPELFRRLSEDIGYITSETGLTFFGGIAAPLAGLAFWLLAPRGVRLDMELQAVVTWRGHRPRTFVRRIPFTDFKLVRLSARTVRTQNRRYRVYDLQMERKDGRLLWLCAHRDSALQSAVAAEIVEASGLALLSVV